MQTRYLVTYDISDPARLRKVYKTMRGYGEHLQYSVFRCDLTARDRVVLEGLLSRILHHEEDQVLFARLGPTKGRGEEAIETLGRALAPPRRTIVV